MLVGYVSDERYLALADVLLEFESGSRSVETRSRASGAVYADIEPGQHRVTLQKPGYGAKRTSMRVVSGQLYQFRLLSDCLLGYAWPKWVRAGEQAEFRVHSLEPYKISLWRYGWHKEHAAKIGWFDEHGPLATMQITPDGDYTQSGVEWNQRGYSSRQHGQFVTAPERSRPLLCVPVDRGSGHAEREDRRAGLEYHLERVQLLWRAEQLHSRRCAPPYPDSQCAART